MLGSSAAIRAASSMSWTVASGRPKRMFSPIVSENRKMS
jgi:hypothetical protein